MTRVLGRFHRWLTAPAAPQRLALLRVLVAGYATIWIVARAPHLRDVTQFADQRWRPVGVLAGLDTPPSGGLVAAVAVVAFLSSGAVLVGWRHRLSGPTFAVTLLLLTTWRNGWGQIFHTEHLLVLHAIVLAAVPASAVWSLDARRRKSPPASEAFGWPIRVMALMTVSTYFVAGVAKIRYGGGSWLDGDVLTHQVAFDNIRKAAVGSTTSPIAGPLLSVGWIFTPMALTSLVVELGAPLALLSVRAARLWAGVAWMFHLGIVVIMVIVFAYPVSGIALAPVLLAHGAESPLPKVQVWVRDRIERRRSDSAGSQDNDARSLAPR